eukprot:1038012-Ditylum_brightwellii.AAC.1
MQEKGRGAHNRGPSSHVILKCGLKGQHQACIPHIWNRYLNTKHKEKIWFVGGKECSEDQGKVLVIVRALYGFRNIVLSWRAALAELLFSLGYKSTKADPDIWICPAVTKSGMEYYEMLCVCVDDIVA